VPISESLAAIQCNSRVGIRGEKRFVERDRGGAILGSAQIRFYKASILNPEIYPCRFSDPARDRSLTPVNEWENRVSKKLAQEPRCSRQHIPF